MSLSMSSTVVPDGMPPLKNSNFHMWRSEPWGASNQPSPLGRAATLDTFSDGERSRVQTPVPAYVPPFLRAPAGKTLVTRSASDSGGFRTTSGIPANSFLNPTAVPVEPVQPRSEFRLTGITGYRGYIPGVKAETVWGTRQTPGNELATSIRPYETLIPKTEDWGAPGIRHQGRRCFEEVEVWRALQEDPKYKWMGHELPRQHGPGIAGYSGNHTHKQRSHKIQQEESHTMAPNRRQDLSLTMQTDRDCHPVDVHRPAMPRYAGYIPGKKTAC